MVYFATFSVNYVFPTIPNDDDSSVMMPNLDEIFFLCKTVIGFL